MQKLKVLDLFSGIGGFSLGLERTSGFETVAFCEIDPFCQKVLRKHWPDVPIFDDVRELTGDAIGPVDVITGGYPCQPFSLAGQRRGEDDDRHLWPEMYRLVAECRPSWVIGENVAGHIGMGLDQVLSDLENAGYGTRAFVVPAVAVDAPHRRDRLWIVADMPSTRRDAAGSASQALSEPGTVKRSARRGGALAHTAWHEQGRQKQRAIGERTRPRCEPIALSNANAAGLQERKGQDTSGARQDSRAQPERGFRWLPEPDVGRVAHGVPSRVDRLKALGNTVVPQIPEIIGRAILGAGDMTSPQLDSEGNER